MSSSWLPYDAGFPYLTPTTSSSNVQPWLCLLDSDHCLHVPSGSGDPSQPDGSGDPTQPDGSGASTQPDGSGDVTQPASAAASSSVAEHEEPSTSSGYRRSAEPTPAAKRVILSSETLCQWNLPRLIRELGSIDQCVAFAEQHNLVAKEKICRTHRVNMKITSTNDNVGSWVCYKKYCKKRISRTCGTFFENIKIDIRHVFYLIYAYAHNWSYKQTIHEDPIRDEKGTCLSRATIADWFNYCREAVVIFTLENEYTLGKIGGPGKVVQIDESKFGKRKYNKGRHIEGHWVLGMIEDGSEDLRLEVCPGNKRTTEVLVPLIQKHVEVGTTIHTDYWRAYDCLSEHGYTHKKVNHPDPDNPFVAPDGTHTQRIESQWRAVKRFFRKENYNNTANFADLIVEYVWRRKLYKTKDDKFMCALKAIEHVYKVNV